MPRIASQFRRFPPSAAVALVLSLAVAGPTWAEPPKVDHLYPAGGAIGTTVTIQAQGAFPDWPVEVWSSNPRVSVAADADNQGRFQVAIDEQAPPGPCWLRFHTPQGASKARPFLISHWETVTEEDWAKRRETDAQSGESEEARIAAETRTAPLIIDGRLSRSNEVDSYAFRLARDETITLQVTASTWLQSPMDAVLQVADATGRYVLAQVDDSPGLDPALVFRPASDGVYQVRLFAFPETPNSSIRFSGGENHIYRLAVSREGVAQHAYPLSATEQQVDSLRVAGVDGRLWEAATRPLELGGGKWGVADSPIGWAVFEYAAGPILWESPDSDWTRETPALADALPVTVSGRLTVADDSDLVRVVLQKDQTLRCRAAARSEGSYLDPRLSVLDASGQELAENDDASRSEVDSLLTFKAPADGEYLVSIRDLHGQGGPGFFYRLDLEEPRPDFALRVEQTEWTGKVGEAAKILVQVERRDGFAEKIEVTPQGLPEGVTAQGAVSDPSDETKGKVEIVLQSGAAARGAFQIVGSALDSSRRVLATPAGDRKMTDQWLTILP